MRAACTLHAKSSRGVRGRNGEGVKVRREERRKRRGGLVGVTVTVLTNFLNKLVRARDGH